ncbi:MULTISPECIES: hypothetical protein [unclassified Microbacterium]|uniref:hypothetical protein n=1 Tax=unclassified Microbacterium TaxID=2609290 RepID=UPI000C2BC1D3|nr:MULTISPECIES: hypothetical protein [unclassified Microbacterium]
MTDYTDRADALKTALQDVVRDLEADLGKLARHRGRTNATTSGPSFRDPGPNRHTYNQQRSEHPGRVQATVDSYRPAFSTARDLIGNALQEASTGPERTIRTQLIDTTTAAAAITTHDDARTLVATFEE